MRLVPLNREDYFRPFEQAFDRILNEFQSHDLKNLKSNAGYPKMDVMTHGNEFLVEVAIPGVQPDQIKVEIEPRKNHDEHDVLSISGTMENTRTHAEYHIRELSRKTFKRSMLLPQYLRGDPQATYKNGLLTLIWQTSIPKPLKQETKMIEVKTV